MKIWNICSVLLTIFVSQAFSICRPLNDAEFMGIFGKIYIREHHCTDVDFAELRNHIATKVDNDGLYFIENSNIGSIKTELVSNNRANQIITVSCVNCQIKEIEKEGLKKLVKLYNLTLVGNDFDYFDGTYIKNDNLRFQHLNLTNNNIKKVANLCLGLPTTKTIVLRDNPIADVDENMFKGCFKLQYLDLSNTSIKLTKNMFQNNSVLSELHIANLNLKNIENAYFNVPGLIHLDISQNGLTSFDTKLFDYYKSLRILDLNGNSISVIFYEDNVKSFPLRQLFLQNNKIKNISILNLEYFKEIQTLDLSFNDIKEIPVHFFEHCNDLRNLILANNQLKKIPVGTFSPVNSLVVLDISYNNFSSFEEQMINSLMLEEFHISGNNLTSFEPYLLGSMVATIKRLGISDLKWNCESLNYIVRFCKTHNINCLPKRGPNYKTSNVQGISCIDGKKETKSYVYQPGLNEEYLNLTRDKIIEQNRLYEKHLEKIGSINFMLAFLTIFVMIFVVFKVILPTILNYYGRYKNNQELLNSNHLNVSHMELVQNNVYGQA